MLQLNWSKLFSMLEDTVKDVGMELNVIESTQNWSKTDFDPSTRSATDNVYGIELVPTFSKPVLNHL